ncbi:MAG: hypothetical protein ACR2NV_10130 [Thermoleophilaceae bacterium]
MRRLLLAWYLPLLAAILVAIVAVIVVGISDPAADSRDPYYRVGLKVGVVLRYVVLVGLATFLAQRLARSLAADEGGRRRPVWIALWGAGLAVVLALTILPPLLGSSDEERGADQFRAGFIKGCSDQQPGTFCTCLFDTLSRDPASDTMPELERLFQEAQRGGAPPLVVRQAAARCGGR